MHSYPWRVPQRGQELWLRQLAPLDGDRRADDLPVVVDEEQLQVTSWAGQLTRVWAGPTAFAGRR